ncbi:MAG: hypothetical protein ACO2PM_15455 [Pyrobaculum sp.]
MRKYPWMVEVARQRPMNIPPPVYSGGLRGEGWVRGVSLPHPAEGFLRPKRRGGGVRLELAFNRHEVYEGKVREVHRPKGLQAYAAAARENVRML